MHLSDLLNQTGSIICQTDTAEFDFTSPLCTRTE